MQIFKKFNAIFLLIATNFAVMLVLSVIGSVLGLDRYISQYGVNWGQLLLYAALFGFGGAIFSLLISKTAAKFSTGAQVITEPGNETERWLLHTVRHFAERAGIAMPEVAIYEGAPNAFATGPSRNNALVAVSTGLLQAMNKDEAEAVLGHEIAHVANGDMVTMTLIQGVVNTFVIFLSRVAGFLVDSFLRRGNDRGSNTGMAYFLVSMVMQIVLGMAASLIVAWFSRQREFRADAGSATYMGNPQAMINALRRLQQMQSGTLPPSMAAAGIAGGESGWSALFASHPPLEVRIAALQNQRVGLMP